MAFGATPKDSGGVPLGCAESENSGLYVLRGSTRQKTDSFGTIVALSSSAYKYALLNQASALVTANGNTGPIEWSDFKSLSIDVNCTGSQGTTPTLQILVDRLMSDNATYVNIWDSGAQSVSTASGGSPVQISQSIGPGLTIAKSIGLSGRVRWVIGGTSTPGATFSLSIIGE